VAGDPYQLESLFASLLENATHYTPDGGAVTVTSRAANDDLVVEIADTGVGFTDEERGNAFQRL
jgi:two-component system phosphate regulon sensor histidine kinase PhoR